MKAGWALFLYIIKAFFFHFSQVELQRLLENLHEEMCPSPRIEEAISIIPWPLFHPPRKIGEVKVILKVNT